MDLESGGGDVGAHYAGWKENPKKCPQYLHYIHETDGRYTSGPSQSLLLFHKLLVLKNMKRFYEKHGEAKYTQLCSHYPDIMRGKYRMQDAKTKDLTLFMRES